MLDGSCRCAESRATWRATDSCEHYYHRQQLLLHSKKSNCDKDAESQCHTSLDVLLFASPTPRQRSTPARDAHVSSSPAIRATCQHNKLDANRVMTGTDDVNSAEDVPSAPSSPSSMCISDFSSPSAPPVVDDQAGGIMASRGERDLLADAGARQCKASLSERRSFAGNAAPALWPVANFGNSAASEAAQHLSSDQCCSVKTQQQVAPLNFIGVLSRGYLHAGLLAAQTA